MKTAAAMKAAGAMRFPAWRRFPIVRVMVAAGVVLIAIGAAAAVRGPSPVHAEREGAAIEGTGAGSEVWGFVLRADTAHVLRHRPGLEPADFLRTHAFGWDGPTLNEVSASPALVKELRLQPGLSPIELIRLEARGS